MRYLFLSFLAVSMLIASPALAADYYVDFTNGSNGGACSETEPCLSLNMTGAQAGDTIHATGTRTDDHIALYLSGDQTADVIIQAWEGKDQPILDAADMVNPSAAIMIGGSGDVVLDGFLIYGKNIDPNGRGINVEANNVTIQNCTVVGSSQEGIVVHGQEGISLLNNTLYNNNKNIHITQSSSDILINGNTVYSTLGTDTAGIYLQQTTGVVVQNNNIYGFSNGSGVFLNDSLDQIAVINNTFYNNQGHVQTSSMYTYTSADSLVNNIFYGGSNGQCLICDGTFSAEFHNNVYSDYNLFYPGSGDFVAVSGNGPIEYATLAEWQAASSQDAHSQEADPLLTSTTTGQEDFHLTADSPARNAGTEVTSVITDIDDEPRPYKDLYDIGSDESPIPYMPGEFAASNITTSSVSLTWQLPTSGYTNLIINYSTDSSLANPEEVSLESGVETTTLFDLSADTTYYACIYTSYTTDYQTYSSACTEAVEFTTTNTQLKKIKNLSVKKKFRKRKSVRATWKKHSLITQVQLQKWNKKKKKYKKHKTYRVKKNKSRLVMKKLKPKTRYRLRARKRQKTDQGYNYSTWTSWKKFKTKK